MWFIINSSLMWFIINYLPCITYCTRFQRNQIATKSIYSVSYEIMNYMKLLTWPCFQSNLVDVNICKVPETCNSSLRWTTDNVFLVIVNRVRSRYTSTSYLVVMTQSLWCPYLKHLQINCNSYCNLLLTIAQNRILCITSYND